MKSLFMAGAFRGLLWNSQCKATPATTVGLDESALLTVVLNLSPRLCDALVAPSLISRAGHAHD